MNETAGAKRGLALAHTGDGGGKPASAYGVTEIRKAKPGLDAGMLARASIEF